MTDLIPSIPQWFVGKNVFITGGTGFMGKVLIEKLLRSCPDLGNVYVLVRPKKGKSPSDRIKVIVDGPLFQGIKEKNPNIINKLIPIEGDVRELGLGISPENRKILTENIHVIYHAAASVRFDDSLRDAIFINTRSTREIIYLAYEMKNLEVFQHISTTYCNTDRKVIDEIVYPPHADWRDAIRIAEETDPHILDVLTAKYIEPLQNTYTFTKSLAEHVVKDLCSGKIPAVILRPSIVISTLDEPIKGWTDNFNGPVGMFVATGKGILKTTLTNPDLTADFLPVDVVMKCLVATTWFKGITKDEKEKLEVSVYNASNNKVNNLTSKQISEIGMDLCSKYPLNNILWTPSMAMTRCKYYHSLQVYIYHLLPALLIDGLLKLTGNKTMLLKVQRRIYIANLALQPFIINEWQFINNKALDMDNQILPQDYQDFSYLKDRNRDPYTYFKNALLGARQYLLNEDNSTIDQARVHAKRMFYLSKFVDFLKIAAVIWFVISLNPHDLLMKKVQDFQNYFTSVDDF